MNILQRFFNLFKKEKKVQPILKFGWKRDLPDPRDFKFKVTIPHELPPSVDLRPQCPPDIFDQGDLGSCTANALGSAYQFEEMKQGTPSFAPSRLFIYYNEREIEGTINQDAGATIRDGIKTMVDKGVCPETMWPYKICKFKKRPDETCYTEALNNKVTEYLRISPHSLYEVKHCLSEGYPIAFGFTIFESFMSDKVNQTGIAPMPQPNESTLGGHAVLAVGYDDTKQALIIRNSWGKSWGLDGYFYLPYGYVSEPNLSADFWTIRLVE
jgi:C1A family cysteine protease